jgi:hypothetical protein
MTPEHLALNIHATGFAHYGGCHSDTCTVGKPTEGCVAGKRHRRRNGSTEKARCKIWSKVGDGQSILYVLCTSMVVASMSTPSVQSLLGTSVKLYCLATSSTQVLFCYVSPSSDLVVILTGVL